MYKIKLNDLRYNKPFIKCFDTQYAKDKFINKLKYSKYLVLLEDYTNQWNM